MEMSDLRSQDLQNAGPAPPAYMARSCRLGGGAYEEAEATSGETSRRGRRAYDRSRPCPFRPLPDNAAQGQCCRRCRPGAPGGRCRDGSLPAGGRCAARALSSLAWSGWRRMTPKVPTPESHALGSWAVTSVTSLTGLPIGSELSQRPRAEIAERPSRLSTRLPIPPSRDGQGRREALRGPWDHRACFDSHPRREGGEGSRRRLPTRP